MDKETLSNYGWIVICTLVLAIMIALATPFGDYVANAVRTTTQGLFDTNKNALSSVGIDISDQSFKDGDFSVPIDTPLHFGERYICTTYASSTTHSYVMNAYFIFYEDGSAIINTDNEEEIAPKGSFTYSKTGITSDEFIDGEVKIIEDGKKLDYDNGDQVFTLASEIPAGAMFTDGTYLTWEELKTKYPKITDTAINDGALQNCTTLKNIVISNTIKSIGVNAFNGCSSLTSVVIPEGVTTIDTNAFRSCNKLTSVTIPSTVTSINLYAFLYDSKLTSVHITDLTAWCNISFSDESSNPLLYAKNLYLNGKLIKDLVIPSEITAIKKHTFNGGSFTSITIPNTVTSIGSYAFYNCQSLPNIIIPDTITSIGTGAFKGCTSLTSIEIPSSIKSISGSAFYDCKSLANVTIPNTVTSINAKAFYNCTSLKSVTLPNAITFIGENAFAYSGITSVVIPNSMSSIGSAAFNYCTSLTNVTIPNTIKSIGVNAFNGCSSLTSVVIPEGVTTIDTNAFRSCNKLTSVTIPSTVTSINLYAFLYDSKLTSVHITDLTAWCNISFSDESSNPLLYAKNLYLNGKLIKDLVIPSEITAIKKHTFNGGSFTSITIPNTVTSIGSYAFYNVTTLQTITFEGAISEWNTVSKGSNWKKSVPTTCQVICTDGTVAI